MSAPKNHITCWRCGAPFPCMNDDFWAHVNACRKGLYPPPPCRDCGTTGEPRTPGYGPHFRKDGRCGDCYEAHLGRLRER